MRKYIHKALIAITMAIIAFPLLSSCSSKENKTERKSIAVFIPGIMADSPIYANLAKGVQKAVESYNQNATTKAEVNIHEAGTNQAEWQTKIIALAATGKYDVIISSNPSLPELVEDVTKQFPEMKFILLDAAANGNPAVAAVSYDQKAQAYISGYIAALMSKNHKIGLIAAQEYPVMNNILYPFYQKGGADAVAGTSTDFRIVGNWYDASKGAELTKAMVQSGVDVILPICGGASQGVISAAIEQGIKLNWFDENGFSKAMGTIISSAMVEQEKVSEEVTKDYLEGKTVFGKTTTVGISDGCIEFIQDDELYIKNVPEDVRNAVKNVYDKLKSGELKL
ncbi:MAG: BMP family ABC transporter substrate-binding protein [Treponema sp.]|nr:BMP family ABC transporter substrate-binding protein [Treponema sp.]